MNFEKLNSLQNGWSNDLKSVADGQTTQPKHTHPNSLGWTSAWDVNARALTPCSFLVPCRWVLCPSLSVVPRL